MTGLSHDWSVSSAMEAADSAWISASSHCLRRCMLWASAEAESSRSGTVVVRQLATAPMRSLRAPCRSSDHSRNWPLASSRSMLFSGTTMGSSRSPASAMPSSARPLRPRAMRWLKRSMRLGPCAVDRRCARSAHRAATAARPHITAA
ncbi:hypothetical protein [Streptomyces sp. NPDC017940]|uniref:hypothetical protein n=1 Tax=Streptomyces sp. NPDC017940 TaxID=3365017 RepID=UPI00378D639E